MARCIEDAKKRPHATIEGKTVWPVFEEERPLLMAYRGPFDGFHATEVSVCKTSLVRLDNTHDSVAARAVGRTVDVRAYADRIVIRQDGETVAEHPRSFGRGTAARRHSRVAAETGFPYGAAMTKPFQDNRTKGRRLHSGSASNERLLMEWGGGSSSKCAARGHAHALARSCALASVRPMWFWLDALPQREAMR